MELDSGSVGPPGGHNPPGHARRGARPSGLCSPRGPSGGSWLQYFSLFVKQFSKKFRSIRRTFISAQKQHHGTSVENNVSPG